MAIRNSTITVGSGGSKESTRTVVTRFGGKLIEKGVGNGFFPGKGVMFRDNSTT